MAFGISVIFLVALAETVLSHPVPRPIDCEDIHSDTTGIYLIYPEQTNGVWVRCDMDTEGGGWTVIQRRVSASDFYQDWDAYEIGFGFLDSNFWLGNLQISAITSHGWYQLRVDMVHDNGTSAFAGYTKFAVGDKESDYQLWVNGYYGDAGDSLKRHNGRKFSAKGKDFSGSCAARYQGAWWYVRCHSSNLNGVYGSKTYGRGINWSSYSGYYSSLSAVEMKIKRFTPAPRHAETILSEPN